MSSEELRDEQQYVTMLYGHLDDLREQATTQLGDVLLQTGGTHQAKTERDATNSLHLEQLAQFNAVEHGLCFGRLDLRDGEHRYIGRLGIFDHDADYEPLLIDWRAPAARPFYLATAAAPDGIRMRRHIRTTGRTVTGIDDDVLDLHDAAHGRHQQLVGEAALLAALNTGRTGRMQDIVQTIQAEQDQIIRSTHTGVLVVQGGPGTGKTAVAMHRAAYLLYTHRRELSQRGVLIVGPNPTFLHYISQVLPSLGETGVLLSTIGELYPGIRARRAETPETAQLKGDLSMTDVLAAAVADRQTLPDEPVEIIHDREPLHLRPETVQAARDRARRTGRPHNQAKEIFVQEIIDALAQQIADRIGEDILDTVLEEADLIRLQRELDELGAPEDDTGETGNLLGAADLAELRRELRQDPAVQAAADRLWPTLTPQQLLTDLYADTGRLATAAPRLSAADRDLLHRTGDGSNAPGQWTPADVPLLDEAAELLGPSEDDDRALAEREHRARVAYAQGVLDISGGSASMEFEDEESELLAAHDLIVADELAGRHEDGDMRSVAERAAADRQWTFGHIIVDEAQELSEMAWRLLMRRCPSRYMTLVGDVAQTGELAGTASWQRVLSPYVADRWRLEELTVNYRTPAEIMAVAADVLAEIDPTLRLPLSVRESGKLPWRAQLTSAQLTDQLGRIVAEEAANLGQGRLAVLVPAARLDELDRLLGAGTTRARPTGAEQDLEQPVVVLTVKQAKGLEFDSVLIVDPAQIVAESARGLNDLYVALTRATQRLGVVHLELEPDLARALRALPDAGVLAATS